MGYGTRHFISLVLYWNWTSDSKQWMARITHVQFHTIVGDSHISKGKKNENHE